MPISESLVILKEDWEADIKHYEKFIETSGCSQKDIEIVRLLIEQARNRTQKLDTGC